MSSKNEFKAFSIDKNANVVGQDLYEESHNLYVGFPQNNIPTNFLNKVLRQSSTISSVVADFIATQSGDDILDNGDVAKLITQLNRALEQKTITSIPDASLTQKGIVQLTNEVGNSDTLVVTQKLVKEIVNSLYESISSRVPYDRKVNGKRLAENIDLNAEDVGAYYKHEVDVRLAPNTASKSINGWWRCGNSGITYQWGIASKTSTETSVYFNNSFSEVCLNVQLTLAGANEQSSGANISVKDFSTTRFTYYSGPGENSIYWFAIGY
ncbi:gp53-like domain-containing protein [Photorhabdus luminescens]|uniref:Putative tail fiber protein gp53-like C-terminal domain-containing protein n=1 Tax=Photorhabdus luminescens subsp. mexicana TaxID=2100167 RepID=A0A4R4IX42_PHOLU|nr:tail fiber protein [Photorhabdus luminescens]TDB45201.1 hypothetical protein C5468_21790 [Photorhabdus luminescens subsp. mexicana]